MSGETSELQDQLKKDAALKRDGKKDFKPSSVEVIERPNGRVVVYLFPMTNEITKGDRRVEFDATIGRLELTQSFFIDEMVWQDKLERLSCRASSSQPRHVFASFPTIQSLKVRGGKE